MSVSEPDELVDRFFGPGPWRDALVDWPEAAAAVAGSPNGANYRTADPRLEALVAKAERLIGPVPCPTPAEGLPMVYSRIRAGEEVLELFAVVVRFDTASDVTLSELRIELIYPGNDVDDRFFRVGRKPTGNLPPESLPLGVNSRRSGCLSDAAEAPR